MKSNITQEKKEELLNSIIKKVGEITPNLSFTVQLKEFMKIADYIGEIYEDGFKEGFEAGKKKGLEQFKLN